ncbi:hypothetical protein [Candidatus Thioglobus sp.]|uniref:hypothetical protein n=1 Tax=Candidatus Thioglobus sp. TaxID=2026721 RepID=UPI003D0F1711
MPILFSKVKKQLSFHKLAVFFVFAIPAQAILAGVSIGISPPRFELHANSSDIVKKTLTVYSVANKPQYFTVKTADWTFDTNNQVAFKDEINADSCRPWVFLERHQITVAPKKNRKFRFEIHVPENAQSKECRFALILENTQPNIASAKGFSLPAKAQIGVIVYLKVNGAQSILSIESIDKYNNLPLLTISNQGNAHGRLSGILSASTADKKQIDLSVQTAPILPNTTRKIRLTPAAKAALKYPITLTGELYWEDQSFIINQTVQ